jgi:hypothetical protein
MLERYCVKASTIDGLRASRLGTQIDRTTLHSQTRAV